MTCEACRARCEENDVEPPCDETGRPCANNEIELLPENELAFELYFVSRMEGIGPTALELEFLTNPELKAMTEEDAWDLLEKFKVLALTVRELEAEDMKIATQNAGK